MRKISKAVAAAGLAAATIVSGLSFGTAAATATTTSENAVQQTSSRVSGPFATQNSPKNFWAATAPRAGEIVRSTEYSTWDAAKKAASTWTFPAQGSTGPIQYPGTDLCLTDVGVDKLKAMSCEGTPNQTWEFAPVSNIYHNGTGLRLVTKQSTGNYKYLTQWRGDPAGWVASSSPDGGTDFGVDIVPDVDTFKPLFSGSVRAGSVDVGARSAVLEGVAEPDADLIIDDRIPAKANADGAWSKTLSGLKLGKQDVKVEQWKDGSRIGDPITVSVDLAVAPLNVEHFFASDINERVKLFGTGDPAADIVITTPENREYVTPVGKDGTYETTLPAPMKGGNYTIKIAQRLAKTGGGADTTTPVEHTINYGTGVSITTPPADSEHNGGALEMNGRGQVGSKVVITEKDKPAQKLGEADVLANGIWSLNTVDLDAGEHTLVASQKSKGQNTTTAEITINPGVSNVAPLEIQTPADGQTIESSSKRIRFSGTAEPFSHVLISTQTNPARNIVNTIADKDGNWAGAGDLNFDVDYTLNTTYTVEGQPVVRGEHHVRVTHANTTAPSTVITPAEGATVNAPNKQVELSGTAPTGTKVTIWNWSGKDRVVAPVVVADGDGKWTTIATLNNQNTTYALHVEYARTGTPTTQTRTITVVNNDAVTKPFQITAPGQNDTVIAPDKKVTITGEATTGTTVTIWNYHTKDRVIGTAVADKNGKWSTTGDLNNQNSAYALHVEYTMPGEPTKPTTLNITVKATANTEKPFQITSPANGSTSTGHTPGQPARITWTGTGTTGATIQIHTEGGRLVNERPITVDQDGNWTGTGNLAVQPYKLKFTYTPLNGTPTTADYLINVTP